MVDRIFKNPKTTIVGVFIVGISLYAFFIDKVGLMEMFAGMGAGFVMFGLKDGKKSE